MLGPSHYLGSVRGQEPALQRGPPATAVLRPAGAEPQSQPADPLPSRPASEPAFPDATREPHHLHHIWFPQATREPNSPGSGGQPHPGHPTGGTLGSSQAAGLDTEGEPSYKLPSQPSNITDPSRPLRKLYLSPGPSLTVCPGQPAGPEDQQQLLAFSPGERLRRPATTQILGAQQQPVGVRVRHFVSLPLAAGWQAEDGYGRGVQRARPPCSPPASEPVGGGDMSSHPEAKGKEATAGP